ncbi:MAG: DUF6457 domain-containing protein [Acidimicrobiales bacterium]
MGTEPPQVAGPTGPASEPTGPDGWLAALADALSKGLGPEGLGSHEPSLAPGAAETSLLLDLARVVAHSSERRNAPLATYLAGRYAATRTAQGATVEQALTEAVQAAEAVASRLVAADLT